MPDPSTDLEMLADPRALRELPVHERPKPRMRGRLHRGAFIGSIPAGVLLVLLASDARTRVATSIYAFTLSGLFGVSAAYHLGDWTPAAHRRMQRLDHSMIFLLIAGTYTPFCLLVLQGALATVMLAAVWAGAVLGVATKYHRVDLHVTSGFMYVGLGWLVAVSFPALLRGLDTPETVLVVAGGVLYSIGALALATKRPNPWPRTFGYHEVWHAATIVAALCQYLSILLVVIGVRA